MTFKLIYLARRSSAVTRKDWPRTWRSHAVFASGFPALGMSLSYLRYCNRIDVPLHSRSSASLASLSRAHDGVAIAGGDTLQGLTGQGLAAEDRALIEADELRVFDRPTSQFTFYCSETVVHDGPLAEVALFQFLARKPQVPRAEFHARWSGPHAGLVRSRAATGGLVTRHAQNTPVHDPLPLFPSDGIAETWFDSVEAALSWLTDPALYAVTDDLCTFADRGRSVTLLTNVCHRWPKG